MFSDEKIRKVAEVYQGYWLVENGLWLKNVYQTHLELSSGKPVLQKKRKSIRKYQLSFFSNSGAPLSSEIIARAVGNRTDLVELVQARDPVTGQTEGQQYMVCDFTKWEKLSHHSKRDHCKTIGHRWTLVTSELYLYDPPFQ